MGPENNASFQTEIAPGENTTVAMEPDYDRVSKEISSLREQEANDTTMEGNPEDILSQLEDIPNQAKIQDAVTRLINLDPSLRQSDLFGKGIDAIKNMILGSNQDSQYDIGSFFEADIVEDTLILYPNDPRFGAIEIGVSPNTTIQEIGTQLLQGLIQSSALGTFEATDENWKLVEQIENRYGVKWDDVREI